MRKFKPTLKKIFFLIFFILFFAQTNIALSESLSSRLKGRILLQAESHGEAWYINPDTEKRIYLGRPADAFNIMRELGLGITNNNLDKIAKEGEADKDINLAKKLSGKILLQVEKNGEAWYVNPQDYKRYFLGRPLDAFNLMRRLGLGISNENLKKIEEKKSALTYGSYITGQVINSQNNPVQKELSIFVNSYGTGEAISYYETSNGQLNLEKLDSGTYQLEIWDKDALYNNTNAKPIYSDSFNLSSEKFNLGSLKAAEEQEKQISTPQKASYCNGLLYNPCPQGYTFFCPSQGKGECRQIAKKPNYDTTKMETQLYAIINYERRKNEMPALKLDTGIADFAKAHSNDMHQKNYFSCTKPDGCDLICRFNRDNYLHSDFSEIISSGFLYKSTYSDGVIAEYHTPFAIVYSAVQDWIQNEDYKKIITSTKFENHGAGIIIMDDEKMYITNSYSTMLTPSEELALKNLTNSLISQDDSAYDKIRKIHTWITNNISYDGENFKAGTIPEHRYTSVGAFRDKIAVCQGYAELLRLMLRYVNIPSEMVSGSAYINGEYIKHAWNKIALAGEALYIDSTWDAGGLDGDKFIRNPRETYLLIPKECIQVDHIEEGGAGLSIEEQKNYVNSNIELFDDRCPLLKKVILAK